MPRTTQRYSSELWGRMCDALSDAVFEVDAQARIVQTNSAFTDMLGYGSDDIPGLRYADITAQFSADAAPEATLRDEILRFELYYLLRAEKKSLACSLIAKSGEHVQVHLRSIVERGRAGRVLRVIGIAVPDRRGKDGQPETHAGPGMQPAWETEQNYRNILEHSGDAIIIADLNGWIVTVNAACSRMLGYERPEDITGKYLLEFIPVSGSFTGTTGQAFEVTDAYYAAQAARVDELFEAGLVQTDGYMLRKDAKVFPVEATMSLLRDQQGRERGTITICRDITDRTVAELELRQSRTFLENIFETVADGLYVVDHAGIIRMVNRALCEIVERSEQELIGTALHDLFPAVCVPGAAGGIDAQPLGSAECCESVRRKKDGSLVHVEHKVTPFSGPCGAAAVGSLRDITERTRFMKQLRRAHDELEHTVQERTHDLQEANTSLRVLLNNREQERAGFEKKLMSQVYELVLPYLEKMNTGSLDERHRAFLKIATDNLSSIFAPLEDALTTRNVDFTPMETQVANLVQQGRTTKEIASILSLSPKTVEFHRDSIRRKLGIQNKKVRLRTYLASNP